MSKPTSLLEADWPQRKIQTAPGITFAVTIDAERELQKKLIMLREGLVSLKREKKAYKRGLGEDDGRTKCYAGDSVA